MSTEQQTRNEHLVYHPDPAINAEVCLDTAAGGSQTWRLGFRRVNGLAPAGSRIGVDRCLMAVIVA